MPNFIFVFISFVFYCYWRCLKNPSKLLVKTLIDIWNNEIFNLQCYLKFTFWNLPQFQLVVNNCISISNGATSFCMFESICRPNFCYLMVRLGFFSKWIHSPSLKTETNVPLCNLYGPTTMNEHIPVCV